MRIDMTRAEFHTRGGLPGELMDKGFCAWGAADTEGRPVCSVSPFPHTIYP